MVPDSFGMHGPYAYAYYRADAKSELASLPAIHQGTDHCSACHPPEATTLEDGDHAALDCESCHGGFKAHNNNTDKRMVVNDPTKSCMLCHARLNARPADFPQIESFAAHVEDQGETLQDDMNCVTCHDPHMPL
jgi:hypothetical protein